jgi:hypothetical protein
LEPSKGGYRLPYDPRLLLAKLEAGEETEAVWHELWGELHHHGDVGDASYACVPHLVRIYRQGGITDWNSYAIVATIELARGERENPKLPAWLEKDYFEAIRDLGEIGLKELPKMQDHYALRGILCIVALQKGARTYARFLLEYSQEELLDLESEALEMEN